MENKTIYIVTSGEYSDYEIEAVFTDKRQAELYCATKRHEYMTIEEWETDAVKMESDKEPLRYWRMTFDIKGDRHSVLYDEGYTFTENKKIRICYGCYEALLTTPVDYSEEKVKKIMYDFIAQWKYEHAMNEMKEAEAALERMG